MHTPAGAAWPATTSAAATGRSRIPAPPDAYPRARSVALTSAPLASAAHHRLDPRTAMTLHAVLEVDGTKRTHGRLKSSLSF